jgi:hypothetical protein
VCKQFVFSHAESVNENERKMMSTSLTARVEVPEKRRGRAVVRILIPSLLFFFVGAALSALWVSRSSQAANPANEAAAARLSDATKTVLQHLDSPVEIRFYSILDTATVSDSIQAYAGRVDQLLSQYEQLAGTRVRITRYSTLVSSNVAAAEADGIKAFNIEKGDGSFLGIAVLCNGQKESLSQLAPEWEQALEPDLSRAIARAVEAQRAAQPVARADAATLAEVKRLVPDPDAVTLEAGTAQLRNAAVAQFAQTAQELQAQVKEAQDRFLQAQSTQSEAGQKAALEQLRKIQAEATAKLRQIALNSHAQVTALQQMKKTAP